MSETEIPECLSGAGHAWVSGRAQLNDETGKVEIVSRQCRKCGYEHSFEEDNRGPD